MLNTTHSNPPASLLRYSICRQNLVLFVKGPVYSLSLACPGLLQLIDDAHPQCRIPAIRFTLLQYFLPSVLFHDAGESPVVRLWTRTSPIAQQLAKIVTFRLNWELPVCSAYARVCHLLFVMQLFDTRPTAVIKSQTAIRYTFKCCRPDQISIFSHENVRRCRSFRNTHTNPLILPIRDSYRIFMGILCLWDYGMGGCMFADLWSKGAVINPLNH